MPPALLKCTRINDLHHWDGCTPSCGEDPRSDSGGLFYLAVRLRVQENGSQCPLRPRQSHLLPHLFCAVRSDAIHPLAAVVAILNPTMAQGIAFHPCSAANSNSTQAHIRRLEHRPSAQHRTLYRRAERGGAGRKHCITQQYCWHGRCKRAGRSPLTVGPARFWTWLETEVASCSARGVSAAVQAADSRA